MHFLYFSCRIANGHQLLLDDLETAFGVTKITSNSGLFPCIAEFVSLEVILFPYNSNST
jgi:hypothetical protein